MHQISVLKEDCLLPSDGWEVIPGMTWVKTSLRMGEEKFYRVLGEGPLTLSLDPMGWVRIPDHREIQGLAPRPR